MGNHTPVDGNLQEISSSATSANAGGMAMCHLVWATSRRNDPFHRRGIRDVLEDGVIVGRIFKVRVAPQGP
jgi:hypothetical protein